VVSSVEGSIVWVIRELLSSSTLMKVAGAI
jgi:hypothetical protein